MMLILRVQRASMSYSRFILLISVVFIISCSSVRNGQIYKSFEEDEVEVGLVSDEILTFEVAFIGAIGHSYIFECIITNHSDDLIMIDPTNFELQIAADISLQPIDNEEIVISLKNDSKSLAKRRKTETTLGLLGVGINVLLGASTGLSVGETLLSSAEPLIYIADDRRWYQRNIDSVEDEIDYVNSTLYGRERIDAGQTLVKDVLFPTQKVKGDVDFRFFYDNEEYVVTFPKDIFR